jgi:hypothetical protein
MDNIISVCDRESDMFEYINAKKTQNQRFVVRAKHERIVSSEGEKLTPYIENQSSEASYTANKRPKSSYCKSSRSLC